MWVHRPRHEGSSFSFEPKWRPLQDLKTRLKDVYPLPSVGEDSGEGDVESIGFAASQFLRPRRASSSVRADCVSPSVASGFLRPRRASFSVRDELVSPFVVSLSNHEHPHNLHRAARPIWPHHMRPRRSTQLCMEDERKSPIHSVSKRRPLQDPKPRLQDVYPLPSEGEDSGEGDVKSIRFLTSEPPIPGAKR